MQTLVCAQAHPGDLIGSPAFLSPGLAESRPGEESLSSCRVGSQGRVSCPPSRSPHREVGDGDTARVSSRLTRDTRDWPRCPFSVTAVVQDGPDIALRDDIPGNR